MCYKFLKYREIITQKVSKKCFTKKAGSLTLIHYKKEKEPAHVTREANKSYPKHASKISSIHV